MLVMAEQAVGPCKPWVVSTEPEQEYSNVGLSQPIRSGFTARSKQGLDMISKHPDAQSILDQTKGLGGVV